MKRTVLFAIVAALALAPGVRGSEPAEPSPAEAKWIRDRAVPLKSADAGKGFDDLQPLKKIVGDAKIVAIGEGTHGTSEFFRMKHRLVEFLASEMGYTGFAMEGNMPEAFRIGDYVRTGDGDPEQLVRGLAFWCWTTEEMLGMVRWMRGYNATGQKRLAFTGIDMQLPQNAERNVLDFLDRVDPSMAKDAAGVYRDISPIDEEYGLAVAELPAKSVAGKKLRVAAWLKTAGEGAAVLLVRVDGRDGVLKRATPENGGPRGASDWTRYTVEVDVPAAATEVRFGVRLVGKGTVWVDDAEVSVDGAAYASALDLAFESEGLAGFSDHLKNRFSPRAYTLARAAASAHGGKASARIAYAAPPAGAGVDKARAAAMALDVADRMQRSRAAYVAKSTAEATDWAIQNARVVHQSFEWQADDSKLSREVSMAKNLRWILDRAPAGTKVVLWAHNGHVCRYPGALGDVLAKEFGKDYVSIGLLGGSGDYVAEGERDIGTFKMTPAPVNSVEWYLASARLPILAIDLRGASKDDPASAWVMQPRPFRYIGITGTDDQFQEETMGNLFDVLVYLEQTTASHVLR